MLMASANMRNAKGHLSAGIRDLAPLVKNKEHLTFEPLKSTVQAYAHSITSASRCTVKAYERLSLPGACRVYFP